MSRAGSGGQLYVVVIFLVIPRLMLLQVAESPPHYPTGQKIAPHRMAKKEQPHQRRYEVRYFVKMITCNRVEN